MMLAVKVILLILFLLVCFVIVAFDAALLAFMAVADYMQTHDI